MFVWYTKPVCMVKDLLLCGARGEVLALLYNGCLIGSVLQWLPCWLCFTMAVFVPPFLLVAVSHSLKIVCVCVSVCLSLSLSLYVCVCVCVVSAVCVCGVCLCVCVGLCV